MDGGDDRVVDINGRGGHVRASVLPLLPCESSERFLSEFSEGIGPTLRQ